MAEEAYLVAFDIKDGGPGGQLKPEEKLGAAEKVTIGFNEFEAGSASEPSFLQQGIKGVAICKMVEVKANTAAEAVEVVRQKYAQNSGGERAVVKPHKTNFKAIV